MAAADFVDAVEVREIPCGRVVEMDSRGDRTAGRQT